MDINRRRPFATLIRHGVVALVCAASILAPWMARGQELTGTIIGTVRDQQGGALAGAQVRVSSPDLIGGPLTVLTSDKGHLRFPALPPGSYALHVELQGFKPFHEEHIQIGAGSTIERTPVLQVEGVVESLVVEGAGSRIDARNPGFWTRIRFDDLKTIPTRRSSMFDAIRFTPGISPTSPSSGAVFTVSAFGSGTNENQFLIDGGNFTCPCNGIARSEPGVDFIQEIQIQSMGASAEFGNVQGAVINVVTRQGSNRFLSDLSYYGQTAGLTSQPVRLPIPGTTRESGYGRARFRDVTATLGGPVVRERLWFFAGYQHLRDYSSQPGTDPALPLKYEQDKILAKLTWKLAPGWQLVQSFYDEFWSNPEQPLVVRPFEATVRRTATVPAMTFGHLTHTGPASTVWDVRAGRFVFDQKGEPSSGDRTRPGRFDRTTGVFSGAPQTFGNLTLIRTNAKATITHYRPGLLGADHQWKVGGQVERGEHHSTDVIPSGERFVDSNGQKFEVVSSLPSNIGGVFITAAAFATDAITLNDWLTVNAGVRFDHSRAISQDLPTVNLHGQETDTIVPGRGTLYTWNLWSPRMGVTAKLGADGRTIARASYGRFSQGVLTGEIQAFHPGATAVTTTAFDQTTGTYSGASRTVDASNLQLDPAMRAPHTDEFSVGLDREVGRQLAVAVAYIRKDGRDFIGWTDVGGLYHEEARALPDGRSVTVQVLDNRPADRRFLLTNPDDYSLTYNGLVMVVEKRRSHGWQAFGSYTLSKASGLQSSSGTSAAGAQASTVAPPPSPSGLLFGRDPNDLTNARGRLPNDRPHMFRVMGGADVPRTGVAVSANLQHFSGKPWAESANIPLGAQGSVRVLLEPRGSRRLSSQTLLDLRVSRPIDLGRFGRVELLVDLLNALNDTAEEGLATDNLAGQVPRSTVFIDPRRAMVSVRLNLGR